MCDRGREKGVAIGGRGGECFFFREIVTDPICDKRVLF